LCDPSGAESRLLSSEAFKWRSPASRLRFSHANPGSRGTVKVKLEIVIGKYYPKGVSMLSFLVYIPIPFSIQFFP
jgi:hypothetical protein